MLGDDPFDAEVLKVVSLLLETGYANEAKLVRGLWMDRNTLISTLENIRDWDMKHSEARTLEIVDANIELAFEAIARGASL